MTCFLALEKQPSWQCVGGESPGPGRARLRLQFCRALSQVIEFNGMWPGIVDSTLHLMFFLTARESCA